MLKILALTAALVAFPPFLSSRRTARTTAR